MAAGVADSGLHPVDLAEGRLDTPEASCGEGRALGSVRSVSLERRCQRRTGVAVPELNHVMTPSNFVLTQASARDSCTRHGAMPLRQAQAVQGHEAGNQPAGALAHPPTSGSAAHEPCGTAPTGLSQSATALTATGRRSQTRSPADRRGCRLDADQEAGRADLGIARIRRQRGGPAAAADIDAERPRRTVACGQRDRYQATVRCTASRCWVGFCRARHTPCCWWPSCSPTAAAAAVSRPSSGCCPLHWWLCWWPRRLGSLPG